MQLLTASQVRMLRIQASATVEAALIVRDTLITVYRHPYTRLAAKAAFHALILVGAAAFFSGVLARRGFDASMSWQAQYVESCLEVDTFVRETESVITVNRPLLLAPARERRCNQTSAIANPVLVTPPPAVIVPTAPAKRRGRPKGSKNKPKAA